MEPYCRIVLLALAVMLCTQLMWKGHGKSVTTDSVAFLRYSGPSVTIRLSSDIAGVRGGVRSLPVGTTAGTVMKMTAGALDSQSCTKSLCDHELRTGEAVSIVENERGFCEISIGFMSVRERVLLGIPLEPDKMNSEDWEVLPGIGPKLARAIVANRQIYGDFGSLEGVKRVPGVGEKLLRRISVYF